jgi:hypothetical protein
MEINLHPQYVTIMVRNASLLFQLANCPMVSRPTVTTAWRVLGLRIEETASMYVV